jgi:hypothetical protein
MDQHFLIILQAGGFYQCKNLKKQKNINIGGANGVIVDGIWHKSETQFGCAKMDGRRECNFFDDSLLSIQIQLQKMDGLSFCLLF